MAERTYRGVTGAGEGWAVGGTVRRPYGSTAKTRQRVLAALGVVKVATAEQIRQLMCPRAAGAQTVRNGCLDLGRDGLVESLGSAGRTNTNGNLVFENLWNLTGPGLEAAAAVLDRPVREMGGSAGGAARSDAKHAVKVTDTLAAFLQTHPSRPVPYPASSLSPPPRPSPAPRRAMTQLCPRGRPGTPAGAGTDQLLGDGGGAPGLRHAHHPRQEQPPRRRGPHGPGGRGAGDVRGGRQRHGKPGRPVLEGPEPLRPAGSQKPIPMWETLYGPLGREGYPPLAFVFTKQVGPTALNNRINSVMRMTSFLLARETYADGLTHCPMRFVTSAGPVVE
ncbi:hypothetical protein [Streptomyces sioyaensis]|uniref:hypothetical protein n=1 Tax=Streptomyces sioyaensis TaxID=67364 RepID=UPI003711040F